MNQKYIYISAFMSIFLALTWLQYGTQVNSIFDSLTVTQQLIKLYQPRTPPLDVNTLRSETNRLFETRQLNINDFDPMTGYTPFQTALANPSIPPIIIKELIDNGATSFQETTMNQGVITIAAIHDREPEIFNLLISSGANPMHIERLTTYFNLAHVGNTGLNYLLQHAKFHADKGNSAAYQRTLTSIIILCNALRFQAAIQGNSDNVRASLVAPGFYGQNLPSTTLGWIAFIKDLNLLKEIFARLEPLIIQDINTSIDGKTAFDWAEGSYEIQQLLRTYGGQKALYL